MENNISSLGIESSVEIAQRILAEVMNFRRVPASVETCGNSACEKCSKKYLDKIILAVTNNKPVDFILPAFPGKSPNLEKVLGTLPDYAEILSLRFLENLCKKVKEYYSPGIKIILCSDGRVFSDVVGMKESNISAYQIELDILIEEMELKHISTYNLDDFYDEYSFTQMRDELMKTYGKPLDYLKYKVKNGSKSDAKVDEVEANRMYCGITRFLLEDSSFIGQTKSRAAVQKESRVKAYEVIRRSNAWSELIAERFPMGVRLSIHPQTCEANKLGIRLVGNESWITPWHGVALETQEGYCLVKRSEAEALGATLIYAPNGRPSHFTLMAEV